MTARLLLALSCSAVLAGCGAAPSLAPVGGAAAATTQAATPSTRATVAVHRPFELPTCRSLDFGGSGSIRDQERVDAVADRVDTVARRQAPSRLSVLYVDSKGLAVHVFWVGPVPPAMLALRAVDKRVRVVFHPARYTADQMRAASGRAIMTKPDPSDPASADMEVGSASDCNDGSGVEVEVGDRKTGRPVASVPDSYAAAIRASVGDMPVLIVPGWVPQPL